MRVKDFRAPFARDALNGMAQSFDLAPFAQARRAAGCARRALERQRFNRFDRRASCAMPLARHTAHLYTGVLQAGEDSARAERIARM